MNIINVPDIGKGTPYGKDNPQFKAMWILRQFRMGIVNVKQIDRLTEHIKYQQPQELTKGQVIKIIGEKK